MRPCHAHRMHRIWLVVFALAACSHDAKQADPVAADKSPPPSKCAQVADHVVSIMASDGKATPDQLAPFSKVISTRCDQDHWTAEAQDCLISIKNLDDGDKCEKQLTPDQAKALETDGEAAAAKLGGGPGGPPPPPPAPTGAATPPPASAAAPLSQPAATKKGKGKTGDPDEGGE